MQRLIEFKDKNGNKVKKYYYIAYINERKSILKNLHEMSCHRGIASLYNLILDQNFYWINIFTDIKNYINNCPICLQLHKNNLKKLPVKQILSNLPRERYVMDLMEIDAVIDDVYQRYNYILNIIDHFSKFTGSYLLERKNAKSVLYSVNEFVSCNGIPKILQADNGREFSNRLLDDFSQQKGIKLIHSSPRHPSTNGVV